MDSSSSKSASKKKSKSGKKSSKKRPDSDAALFDIFGARPLLCESDVSSVSEHLVEFDPLVMHWFRKELLRNAGDGSDSRKLSKIRDALVSARSEEAASLLRTVFPASNSEERSSPNLHLCANLLVDPAFVPFLMHPRWCIPHLPPLAMERIACRIVLLFYSNGVSPVRFLAPALSYYAAQRSLQGESALAALLEYRVLPGTMISELHKWTMRFLASMNMKPLMDELHELVEAACRKHAGTLEIDHQRFWPNTPSPEDVASRLDSYRTLMRCVIKHVLHNKDLTKSFSTDLRIYIHHISTLGESVLKAETAKTKAKLDMKEAVKQLLYYTRESNGADGDMVSHSPSNKPAKSDGDDDGDDGDDDGDDVADGEDDGDDDDNDDDNDNDDDDIDDDNVDDVDEGGVDVGDAGKEGSDTAAADVSEEEGGLSEEDKIWRLRALVSSILIKEMLLQSLVAPSKHFPYIREWGDAQARAVFLLAHLIDRCISAKLITEDPLQPFNELIREFSGEWANPIDSVHVAPLSEAEVEAWDGTYEHDGPSVPVWFRLPGTEDMRESTAEAFANLFDSLGNFLSVHAAPSSDAESGGENSTSDSSEDGEEDEGDHSENSSAAATAPSDHSDAGEDLPSYQHTHKTYMLEPDTGAVVVRYHHHHRRRSNHTAAAGPLLEEDAPPPGLRFVRAINEISRTIVVRIRVNKVVIPPTVTGTVLLKLAVVMCDIQDVELRRVRQMHVDNVVEGTALPDDDIAVQEIGIFKLKKRRISIEEDCSMAEFLELQVPRTTSKRLLVYAYCLKGDRASMSSTLRGLVTKRREPRTLYKGLLRHTLDSTIIANEFHLGEWVGVVHLDMQENLYSGHTTIGISHGDGGMGMAMPPRQGEPLGRGALGDATPMHEAAATNGPGDMQSSEGFRPPSLFQVHLDVQRCLAL